MPTPALLRASELRIDVDGPAIERLTVETTGANVAVVGAPRALFEAASGLRPVTHGTLQVCGLDPIDAIRTAAIATAPIDVPVPARWTLRELAQENARLAGRTKREAESLATNALHALQLDAFASTKLGAAEVAIKRAAVLAAAIATGAPALFIEDFTAGLADGAARSLARLFVAACEGKRWVVFAGRLSLSSPLGLNADEALLFAGGRFACAGLPAEIAARERTYVLRTLRAAGEPEVFEAKLRERGARVEADAAGALTVTLPEDLSTHEIVALARAGGVVVLELLPLSSALA